MKRYLIYISVVLFTLSACEDVLDIRNRNVIDDGVWDVKTEANSYIVGLYTENMTGMKLADYSGYSDEVFTSSEGVTDILYGNLDSTTVASSTLLTSDDYSKIRFINIAIDKLPGGNLETPVKNNFLGEALFFRAWRYWEIVKWHGGVPLVLTAQDPFFDDLDVARSSTKKCVEQIVADLDFGIKWLDTKPDPGRISRGAAAAFKGRVLLNWASPMFNPNNDITRWQAAYDANLEAKRILDENGKGLLPQYSKIFTNDPLSNPEAILYQAFEADGSYSNDWEKSIRPVSAGGDGKNSPTWNLVKAFPMANGKDIEDPNSGYDSTYFWHNRDPRFYDVVAYNGCTWKMQGGTSANDMIWTFTQTKTENNRYPGSGFYCKKANNPLVTKEGAGYVSTAWLEIRYAEVLLNLAECAAELDKQREVISLLGEIRDRAGISADDNYGLGSSFDKATLIEKVIKERQVEMCFEGKRFWDLRRRKMFTQDLGPNVKKLNGTKRTGLLWEPTPAWAKRITSRTSEYYLWRRIDTAAVLGYLDIEGDYSEYFKYTVKDLDTKTVAGDDAHFGYKDLYDFFYISKGFLNRSPLVEQTKGWIYGTFDPLAE